MLLVMGAYWTHSGTFHPQEADRGRSALPARSVMAFVKEPLNCWPRKKFPCGEAIWTVAVFPSALRETVVGTLEPLLVWIGIAAGDRVEARTGSEKDAWIGAMRT